MAVTIQTCVDNARLTINDAAKTRVPDAEGLRYAQDALNAILQLRPDLFISQFLTFDAEALTLASNFPIAESYARQVADYIIARAEVSDDESVSDGRAVAALQYFERVLLK